LARARAYREDLDALIAGAPDYQPQASEQGPQESGPVDDAVEIEKLARMPALDYERTRKAAAERLGIKRLSLLDGLVKAKRAELGLDGGDGLQGRAIEFPEPEPWPTAGRRRRAARRDRQGHSRACGDIRHWPRRLCAVGRA
jgi:hypothetical protein